MIIECLQITAFYGLTVRLLGFVASTSNSTANRDPLATAFGYFYSRTEVRELASLSFISGSEVFITKYDIGLCLNNK